jgi:hypothetical protein
LALEIDVAASAQVKYQIPQERPVDDAMMEKRISDQELLIDETLVFLQNAVTGEQSKATVPPVQFPRAVDPNGILPPERTVQEEQRDPLIDQTLSTVEIVAVVNPKAVEAASPPLQRPVALRLPPKDKLDMERAVILRRLATFKANQERFQREREEYYVATMAKVRAIQWTPPVNPTADSAAK